MGLLCSFKARISNDCRDVEMYHFWTLAFRCDV